MYYLVNFETNKFIHGSYHHQKFEEENNLNQFKSIVKSSRFKEHKEFDQISNFFQPSIEIISQEILDDLNANGLKRKEPRLKLFLNDLKRIIELYKNVLHDMNLNELDLYYNSVRKNIMSDNSDVELAIADITNLLQTYQLLEKYILKNILENLSKLVEDYSRFVFGYFYYLDDTREKIEKYLKLFYIILMNKNITKKEIIKLFENISSFRCDYTIWDTKTKPICMFIYDYPLDLENTFETKSEYYFQIMQYINNLSISDRFNKFFDLFNEEKECFYVFKILNTELLGIDEIDFGGITYYNQNIYKSKGSLYSKKFDYYKDHFGKEGSTELKAIIPYKTKQHFSNISALKIRSVIENNLSFFKLTHSYSNEKAEHFKLSSSKMDVSYSNIVLDNNYYFMQNHLTIYDGDNTLKQNEIVNKIFKNDDINQKLDSYMKQLNYKQIEHGLSANDELILQSLQKYKKSIESTNFSELLLLSWNGLEFLSNAINKDNKIDTVEELVTLIYKFIYTDKDLIKCRAKHLTIYAYTYRNKIVHSHLVENSLMISVAKGINIIFKHILIHLLEKIVLSPDFELVNVINQLKSDLNKIQLK